MKRAIKYSYDGKMPERLVEYTADVKSPDGSQVVGKAYASRFGYQVMWNDITSDIGSADTPDLAAVVSLMKEFLEKSGNSVENEEYTVNAGADLTEDELSRLTLMEPGETEKKAWMKRYHDLLSAVSSQPWFRYTRLNDGIRLLNIDGIDDGQTNLLFYCAHPVSIMVPSKLRFPYNVKLRERCQVRVDEYVPIDQAKKDGERDIDCVSRLAMQIAAEYKEKSAFVDGLIAENDRKVARIGAVINLTAHAAMEQLARRNPIDVQVTVLDELCSAYYKLVPTSVGKLDMPARLAKFASLVNVLCTRETVGKYENGKLSFAVDKDALGTLKKTIDGYPELPDEYKTIADRIDPETPVISLCLQVFDGGRPAQEDPANSPYVE